MVREARSLVQQGRLGEIRMVMGEYAQSWLAGEFDKSKAKILWRTDPEYSGVANCVADIGSHLENLVSYVTELEVVSLSASLDIIGEGRKLDTNACINVRYSNGAPGMYWCSRIAIGHENAVRLRVIGSRGALDWEQETPNYLKFTPPEGPTVILSKGNGYISDRGLAYNPKPPGHPDGTYEAFANLYKAFAEALASRHSGRPPSPDSLDYPDVSEGVRGMKFIHACVESSHKNAAWVSIA